MALHDHTYAVIMAGGVGSRFWPMSRSGRPKQFLDILDRGRTLIQMTADRLEPMLPFGRMYVVTNVRYKDEIMAQLPGIPEDQILCEPFMRNTAPCLAYAHHRIALRDPEATIVVASADHLIEDEEGFRDVLGVAVKQAAQTSQLLTVGIAPTRPDTGYGYIQFEELPGAFDPRLQQVRTFTEKPDLELAMVNPEIISKKGMEFGEEGCLSFPGVYAEIERHRAIVVKFQHLDGEEDTVKFEDFLARAGKLGFERRPNWTAWEFARRLPMPLCVQPCTARRTPALDAHIRKSVLPVASILQLYRYEYLGMSTW